MNKKLLIFAPYSCKITDGGPSGFCANNFINEDVDFFDIATLSNTTNHTNSFIVKLKNFFLKVLNFFPKEVSDFNSYLSVRQFFKNSNALSYKFLFFHDVECLFYVLDLINPNQQVLLQPHSPELPSEEFKNEHHSRFVQIKIAENKAFKRANYIVLPNSFVLPIYKPLIKKSNTLLYINSGLFPFVINQKINLSNNTINFLYIGRRNKIKGFDILINVFKELYKTNKNIRLYLIGKGETVVHEAIINVGFSDNIPIWLNSVDYVINTNRQSYFDLSILECLCVGTPLIYSSTNGHKHFDTFKSSGLFNYNFDESLFDTLVSVISNHDNFNFKQAISENKTIFINNFSNKLYLKRLKEHFNFISKVNA